MRRWSGRSQTPAQYDLARIRAIGEWGHASRYVGTRWEELGLGRLVADLGRQESTALLAVCILPELQSRLASTGSKNPDVVIVTWSSSAAVLKPADLKWSLDVARYPQISADVLTVLLDQVPQLTESVRSLLPQNRQDLPLAVSDGVFVCPNTNANQRFLASPENQNQEFPIGSSEVRFEELDPADFFAPLPGWETGRELARVDGSVRTLSQLDAADRYYHLGAGVAGAFWAMEHSVFEEEGADDFLESPERVRAFLGELVPPSTGQLIDQLDLKMRHRRDMTRRVRDLTRGAFDFVQFVAELTQTGLAAETDSLSILRRQWGETYRLVMDTEEAQVRKAGRVLCSKGATDDQALDLLDQQRDLIVRRLRARARVSIKTAVAALATSEPPLSSS